MRFVAVVPVAWAKMSAPGPDFIREAFCESNFSVSVSSSSMRMMDAIARLLSPGFVTIFADETAAGPV